MSRSIYYTRRDPVRPQDFEVGYWGVVTDPDGNRRDLSLEREKKLEDLATELSFVNGLPPGRILDVGCGLGYLLSGVDPRWERHGVEISDYAAERARSHGTIVHGHLRGAAYPNAWFDVVTLYHVIEHMEDPVTELAEIRRVLRPGGWLVVGTPNFDSACARRFGDRFRLLHDATHISLFGAESLRRLLEDHGFTVQREDYPFFETRYFTRGNLERLFDPAGMSPPFYGNIMTFYARRPERSAAVDAVAVAGRAAWRVANESAAELERIRELLGAAGRGERMVFIAGPAAERRAALFRSTGRRAASLDGKTLPGGADSGDVLFVVDGRASRELVLDARRRGVLVVALSVSGGPPLGADVTVEVPSGDPRSIELLHDLLLTSVVTADHESVPRPSEGRHRPGVNGTPAGSRPPLA